MATEHPLERALIYLHWEVALGGGVSHFCFTDDEETVSQGMKGRGPPPHSW